MPNWCFNKIDITGNESEIQRIVDDIGDNEEWMQALVPLEGPEWDAIVESKDYILTPLSTFYGSKWYATRDQCHVFEKHADIIIIEVDSAWSPFTEFCRRLTERYEVDVAIEFFEGGADFGGQHVYTEGKLVESWESDYAEAMYKLDNEGFWSDVEYNMDYYKEEEGLTLEQIHAKYPFLQPFDLELLQEMYD